MSQATTTRRHGRANSADHAGNRRPVLIFVGVLIAILLLPTIAVLADASSRAVIQAVANVAGTIVSAVVLSTLIASIYHELRLIKEGVGPDALAAIFD